MDNNILKQLEEMQKKAELYNVLKGNIAKAEEKMAEALELMQKAIGDLNPLKDKTTQTTRTKHGKQNKYDHEHILQEYYNRLRMGECLTKEKVQKENPQMDEKEFFALWSNKIKRIPKLQKQNIDGKINIFLDNTP